MCKTIVKVLVMGIFSCWLCTSTMMAQKIPQRFKYLGLEETENFRFNKPIRFYEVLCSRTGLHKFSSNFGMIRDLGMEINIPMFLGVDDSSKQVIKSITGEDSIRTMFESGGRMVFFVTRDNKVYWQSSYHDNTWGIASFDFPPINNPDVSVSKMWIDNDRNIFMGTIRDNFYLIKEGAYIKSTHQENIDSDRSALEKEPKEGAHIILDKGASVFCFSHDPFDQDKIWIGSDKGLFQFSKSTGVAKNYLPAETSNDGLITITHIEHDGNGAIWFSTIEKGMGVYNPKTKTHRFFSFNKRDSGNSMYPVKTFCRKSNNEFFVAIMDSVPAIFNCSTGEYEFIQDTIFTKTINSTTDVKLDGFGNLFLIKGNGLFYTDFYQDSKTFSSYPVDSAAYAPFITDIIISGTAHPIRPSGQAKISLDYNQNSLTIHYSIAELVRNSDVQFAWMMEGYVNEWIQLPLTGNVKLPAIINGLAPGRYVFRIKARVGDEDWRSQEARLEITIHPPFWKTWWFWMLTLTALFLFTFIVVRIRERIVRRQEREKAGYEKELLLMESRALRAQMNPHFIFNCMNSIKSLIQRDEKEKAVDYLTVFSRLLRTILVNSDKRQITLYDELETCRLYVQLEAMRFQDKLRFGFQVDETIDLKSIEVPALIIQPFIENAIWHGIMPKPEGGNLNVNISAPNGNVICLIEDDGIGRQVSIQNKSAVPTHDSKGMHLTQSRLILENTLNQNSASIAIIDKHKNGRPTGTIVKITFKNDKE